MDNKFDRKFFNLGPTSLIRIPNICIENVKTIVKKYDVLCSLIGQDKVLKTMSIIEKFLDHEIEKAKEAVTES